MPKILLLQFDNDPDCAERRHILHWVDVPLIEAEPRWPKFFDVVSEQVPDLIVVACSRQPSHGFECARYLGEGFNTRNIPVFLVDVAPKDEERARTSAPRARIVERSELPRAVKEALPSATGKSKIWQPFSEEGRRSIVVANEEAKRLRSQSLGPEHILLGVLAQKDSIAAKVLSSEKLSLSKARAVIAKSAAPAVQPSAEEMEFSEDGKWVITHAFEESQRLGRARIGPEELLLGILKRNAYASSQKISNLLGAGEKIASEVQRRLDAQAQGRSAASSAAMARRN